ncbi:alpha/beta hydrolase family protein [Bacillus sp. B1-b2]|uniref:alpha/beta hydrolase family protein n=1 Tax=Bacillus sp. B1-b2 TaxID=2653201 RepID=UPI00186A10C4|nr:prolyl oligopeptidase family serine peptidase [Bacillus sp. B1-b2]
MKNGDVLEKVKFPSPNPSIDLFVVTYNVDGLRVKGLLAVPNDGKQYDGFLYLRGGIKNVGKVRPGRIVQFASEGFVVFAPFYRGNQGGDGNEDFAGKDRMDAIAAYYLLDNLPNVLDVHVFGFSRGGVMALFVGIYCTVASVVTWGGVSDMTLTYEEREDLRRMMKRVIGGTPSKYPDEYKERTPLYYLANMQAPVLIIHGVQDKNVSVEHSYKLEKELKKLNKEVETWFYEQYTHYFPPAINREVVTKLSKWMKNHTRIMLQ